MSAKCCGLVTTGSKSYGMKIRTEDGSFAYKVRSVGITLAGEAS